MTRAKHPTTAPETLVPDPGARERVRQRLRQMAKLALLAATPLTNAACDPAQPPSPRWGDLPTPTCEKSPSDWARFIKATATWGTQAGGRIILLTITNPSDKPWLQVQGPYAVEGGTSLPPTAQEPDVLRIAPDAGATKVDLHGTMSCQNANEQVTITISLPATGANPIVAITPG